MEDTSELLLCCVMWIGLPLAFYILFPLFPKPDPARIEAIRRCDNVADTLAWAAQCEALELQYNLEYLEKSAELERIHHYKKKPCQLAIKQANLMGYLEVDLLRLYRRIEKVGIRVYWKRTYKCDICDSALVAAFGDAIDPVETHKE